MVGITHSRAQVIGMITTDDGLRAGVCVDDNSWCWLKIEGYDSLNRKAHACEIVRCCTTTEESSLRRLAMSEQIAQTACFVGNDVFLLAVT